MPNRVQRTRKKGGGMPEGAVYVGRPGIFGNPWSVAQMIEWKHKHPALEATRLFRDWMAGTHWQDYDPFKRKMILKELPNLKGKDLACWCPLPKDGEPDYCHAAVLLDLANGDEKC